MGLDLPPGKWTMALIGPWWPASSAGLRAGAQHWSQACAEQQFFSQGLRSQWMMIAASNQGHTADDLISRYQQGEKFHMDLAEKYQAKSAAFNSGADAIDYLRSRLTDIANAGNREIDQILASKKPLPEQVVEVQAVQLRCNGDAVNASMTAGDKLMTATQKILDAEGIGGDARTWARENGFNTDNVQPPRSITGEDLKPGAGSPSGEPRVGGAGLNTGVPQAEQNASTPAPRVNAAGLHGSQPHSGGGTTTGPRVGGAEYSGIPGAGGALPPGVHVPGGGGSISPATPTAPASPVSMSSAGLGQGASPNLAQSFASGMATGQPAGAGAQGLSAGAINAMEPPPQAGPPAGTPPAAPTAPSAGVFVPTGTPVDTPPPAAPAPPTTGGAAPVAPVVTGGSWSGSAAPVSGGPSIPAGSLPAYGSDLRPTAAAPPAMPSVPTGPVSGAPVAPSAASSPSAGGPLVSPVERGAAATAAGHAGANSSSMVGASAMSAATGATAGAVSNRAAEQQRLQRLVDAVARQEPRISWAAGLRDDGTTSLLVNDLAGGWIPPHVRLPAHVTLLEPAARRHDASAVDLLGAVVVAAAHEHNTYVAEADPDAPTLTGDRPARSAAPQVDELGPALVEAVRRRDGLPRIAQAIAAPAVRNTGVLDSETELLRRCIVEIQDSVLSAYPDHDAAAVADWMLLAAIEALIDGHQYLANYHMAWFAVTSI
ncbi:MULTISPECIES: DUF5631 domain-containing protein [unclassified Mycobacterium]|uniref:DUF5631 domain-containing protein n=2 Tax=Mycobacterium TaxID=1763 RepID=UPI0012E89DC5|nr:MULTISPECIES: DUF5631 domain-containing protein [unclassified Mycobacterium]